MTVRRPRRGRGPEEDELRFVVRLVPRAQVDRIDGVDEGMLRCRVAAAPADGAANVALCRLLAAELGSTRSAVRIVAGAKTRRKIVAVRADLGDRIRARWPSLVD